MNSDLGILNTCQLMNRHKSKLRGCGCLNLQYFFVPEEISGKKKKANHPFRVLLASLCCLWQLIVPVGDYQERAHEYYNGMTKEQFKKMQEFIAGRSSKKPASKM